MFGFIVGTACLLGIAHMVRRRRRWARGYGYGHHCGHHHHHGHHDPHDQHGHGGWGRSHGPGWGAYRHGAGEEGPWGGPPAAMASFLASRIDANPEQTRVIRDEIEAFLETTRPLRRELRLSRDDIAKAMRTEGFDEEVMGDSFARQDEGILEIRKALVGALAKIHDALDERQRARLASLLESAPRGFGGPRWM